MSCSPHWGCLLTQRSLARPKLRPLCATRVATLVRVDSRLDTRCIADGRVAGHVPRATLRSRFCSKMSQGRNGPAAGQRLPRRHRRQDRALAAARRLVNKSSDRLHRFSSPSPTCKRCAVHPADELNMYAEFEMRDCLQYSFVGAASSEASSGPALRIGKVAAA
jgi:hypothetical protein